MKKHITLDFDNTLINTTMMSLVLTQSLYNLNLDIDSIKLSEIQWDLKNVLPQLSTQEINNLFTNPHLYDNLEDYIFDGWYDVLNSLKSDGFTLEICTIHRESLVDYKYELIQTHFPMVEKITIIPANNKGDLNFDKSTITEGIHIDDREDCLISSSNSVLKCVYGNFHWNKDCSYTRVTTPQEFYELIKSLERMEMFD